MTRPSASAGSGLGRFGIIWAGFVISFIGTSMARFAVGVQVFIESESVTKFALVPLIATLPLFLLTPLAGAVADRFDRRLVLLASIFASSLPRLVMWWLAADGRLEHWHVYVLVAIGSTFGVFGGPAMRAMVPQLVGKQNLIRAAGLLRTGTSLSTVIGPLLGGLLLASIGLANVILINVASYFFAIAALLIVRVPKRTPTVATAEVEAAGAPAGVTSAPATSATGTSAPATSAPGTHTPPTARGGMAVGWRFIRQRPGLLRLLVILGAMNFFVGMVQVILVPLVLSFATPLVLGLVLSLASAGALVGGATLAAWGGPKRRMPVVFTIMAVQGFMLLLGSPIESATMIAIAAFFYLMMLPIGTSSITAIWQTKTPTEIQGRVFAVLGLIAGVSVPIAQAVSGPLADFVFEPMMAEGGALASTLGRLYGTGEGRGLAIMLAMAGVCQLVLTTIAARTRSIRSLETDLVDAIDDTPTDESALQATRASAAAGSALTRLPVIAGVLTLMVPLLVAALILRGEQPPTAIGRGAPDSDFSAARAQAHVERIAQRPRPTGSAALAEVRDYLRSTLESYGLETALQRRDVRSTGAAVATLISIENVLARLPGTDGAPAVMLMAHYDSVPTSSGAADNGAAVAALVETARALAEQSRTGNRPRHDVIFLFTDAEEIALNGVRAFADDHPWADDVAVAINLEARGHHGPVYMFQTGRDNGWFTREFFRAAPSPRASSLNHEIFKRLPNATDFNVLRDAGFHGFDLAMIRGLTHYHTDLDRPESLSPDSLQHHGDYALSLTRHLADLDLEAATPAANPTYFNVGSSMIRYPTWLARVLAIVVGLATLGLLVTAFRRHRLGALGVLQGILVVLVQMILVPVTISLVWMSIRDSADLSVIMGSTTGAWRYMLGFGLIATALSLLIVRFFRRSASAVDLLAGSLVWWLVVLVLTTDVLVAASASYIALWPLAGAALAFAWLTLRPIERLSDWSTALVLVAAAVPAFVVVTPLVAGLYPALQSLFQISGIALLPWVLALSMLAPHLEAAARGRGWWPSAVLIVAALALLTPALADRGPRLELSSAIYAHDADRDEHQWFSFDPKPAAWTAPLGFDAEEKIRFDRYFPLLIRPMMSRQAPSANLELPNATWLAGEASDTTVSFEIRATDRSRARLLSFDPATAVLSVEIDGTPVSMLSPAGPSRTLNRLPVRPRETVRLRLRDGDPLVMTIVEQLEELPPISPLPPRPTESLPRPFLSIVRTDASFVRRSFQIDPAEGTLVPLAGLPQNASAPARPEQAGSAQDEPARDEPAQGVPSSSASTAATVSSSASASN